MLTRISNADTRKFRQDSWCCTSRLEGFLNSLSNGRVVEGAKSRDGGKKRERASYSGPSSSDALFSMATGILRQTEPRARCW